tara:strand:- start:249 stop:422 length:174 start_codon:yes stop_codon:yes gene_type:complete
MKLFDQAKSFFSKKLAATGAGAAVVVSTGSSEAMWITIAYIVAQAAVDIAKVLKDLD